MPNQSLFIDQLNNSREEQVLITIFLTNHFISGIVAGIHNDTVELRIDGGKRYIIALDKIEAISIP